MFRLHLTCIVLAPFIGLSGSTLAQTAFLVKDIYPGPTSSGPYYMVDLNGKAYFQANDGKSGVEL